MCGIAGYMMPNKLTDDPHRLMEMARVMRHRGPDDEGFVLINSSAGSIKNLSGSESDPHVKSRLQRIEDQGSGFHHDIGMAHRRYSIIDLSPDGHQPMWDAGNTVCVSFYGEIYNYVELRTELEQTGARFNTKSDTEVILQSYLTWGTDCFKRFNGPFAIVLYDTRSRALLFGRDRLGKATFYYTVKENTIYWASEIKAFIKVFGVNSFTVSDQAVHDYIMSGLRDFDGTFWSEIKDFPPGCLAWVGEDLTLKTEKFWQIPETRMTTKEIGSVDAIEEFRVLLLDATRIRCRADVPVAFELSGGMDSSALVALAATNFPDTLTTYTVKNRENHSDEEPYAKQVQEFYRDKIDYRVMNPEKDDFWQHADEFVWNQEEPFQSPNLQTNQQQHRLMRDDGKRVTITGAAGDEVLAGYAGEYFRPYLRYLLDSGNMLAVGRELMLNTEISPFPIVRSFATKMLMPQWANILINKRKQESSFYINNIYRNENSSSRIKPDTSFSEVMLQNMAEWKMNYWLRSGSKADYNIPIEGRAPFLDPRIVDFCFKLPPEYLIKNGWHKWILRQAVKDLLPDAVVWRKKKMGFPFPIREWLTHSKGTVFRNLAGMDCPYVKTDQLYDRYDDLAHNAPQMLWRLISLSLWWRKMIEGKKICGP